MRHRKSGRKLNRNSSHRNAMFRNMVTSLFKHDSIKTTDAKAKELRSLADHIVTLAKRGDLHARRQAMSIVREKDVVHKLFEEAGERFGSVSGGYTRIVKLGYRRGDAAPVSIIELVTPGTEKKKGKKKKVKPDQGADIAKAAPVAAAGKTDTAVASGAESETSSAPTEEVPATEKEETVETASAGEAVAADKSETDEKEPSVEAHDAVVSESEASVETKSATEKGASEDAADAAGEDKPAEK